MNPSLIRKFVDGELNDEEMASFEEALTDDSDLLARVEFERKLRGGVMRATANPENHEYMAPESLHTDIQDMFRNEASISLNLTNSQPIDTELQDEDTIEFLRGPTRANFFAVAACLVIVAGAVLFGIFGPNLLNQQGIPTIGDIKEVSTFVERQHVSCAMDKQTLSKKAEYSPTEIGPAMQGHLGGMVVIPDLSDSGYQLVGGGRCGVPPSAFPSGHVMYSSSGGRAMVGIFMQPNHGQFPQFIPGDSPVELIPDECGGIFAWADENMVYFVTMCDGRDSSRIIDAIYRQTSLSSQRP